MAEIAVAKAIILHENDDVGVLLDSVEAGGTIMLRGPHGDVTLVAAASVPPGHKIALRPLRADHPVRKYGAVIGKLLADVEPGEHVHIHNLVSLRAQARGN